ncbi:hypothetical protein [Streptantibioticus silvisoli]|uniref:C2H2-type domain-containing protein n=1 Tax=Streptantibioticus silvisoli TaxID=2705255 RepID=A0ABT6W612_9ACTN|nr:hypothetical protein [Streptantibioticus silvisoli]MDI5966187.1 hypothetical protein [Streptantibioticus silvisoli]
MSDTFGTPAAAGTPGSAPGTAGPAAPAAAAPTAPTASDTVHEAYSFACMNCGHGWEQSYEIAHRTDQYGHTSVVYYAESVPVPSPLTRPNCVECGGHLVRIMRSGRVSSVSSARWGHPAPASSRRTSGGHRTATAAVGDLMADAVRRDGDPQAADPDRHHWLADFLALFHRRPHAVDGGRGTVPGSGRNHDHDHDHPRAA